MTIQEVRKLYGTRPFKRFIIHLSDGRAIPVEHPEFMAFAPDESAIFVYHLDKSFDIIDLSLATGLKVKPDGSSSENQQ